MTRDHLLGYPPAAAHQEAASAEGVWWPEPYPLGEPRRVTEEHERVMRRFAARRVSAQPALHVVHDSLTRDDADGIERRLYWWRSPF